MNIGDIVVRKSYDKDITFKIIDVKDTTKGLVFILKGINLRIIADSTEEDLEVLQDYTETENEKVFNKQVNSSIRNILMARSSNEKKEYKGFRSQNVSLEQNKINNSELTFGRPGKILHIDGDAEYLDTCLKVYKQLKLEVVGRTIPEKDQPAEVLELVKTVKPDIVVITGHDAVLKDAKDYMDLNNYKNSKYYVETVSKLRNYEGNYDDLVIFAGACQSCYEQILDAGANFASSPNRVLIHCLDPVFLCEKVAYTNIERVVSIQDALKNTITGTTGIGGLQTRGKYREGFPKSPFVK